MTTFQLNPEADIDGTYRIGSITLVPRRLVDRFGPPSDADGYKVSGQYRFVDQAGLVYTLYDWKRTSLFNDGLAEGEESSSPTPEEFWGNENPDQLQIGGRKGCDVEAFKNWLKEQVG